MNTSRLSRSWRLSSWVNDINPVNWKTVLTGWMQAFAIVVFWLGWLIDIIMCVVRKLPTDFHETAVGVVLGFLAGLSGFTLAGRITDRKTDYGYVERVNAGKAIDASAPPSTGAVVTGDGTNVNVTATMPVQRRSTGVVAVQGAAPRAYDPGA